MQRHVPASPAEVERGAHRGCRSRVGVSLGDRRVRHAKDVRRTRSPCVIREAVARADRAGGRRRRPARQLLRSLPHQSVALRQPSAPASRSRRRRCPWTACACRRWKRSFGHGDDPGGTGRRHRHRGVEVIYSVPYTIPSARWDAAAEPDHRRPGHRGYLLRLAVLTLPLSSSRRATSLALSWRELRAALRHRARGEKPVADGTGFFARGGNQRLRRASRASPRHSSGARHGGPATGRSRWCASRSSWRAASRLPCSPIDKHFHAAFTIDVLGGAPAHVHAQHHKVRSSNSRGINDAGAIVLMTAVQARSSASQPLACITASATGRFSRL